jgi:hypothetical protein
MPSPFDPLRLSPFVLILPQSEREWQMDNRVELLDKIAAGKKTHRSRIPERLLRSGQYFHRSIILAKDFHIIYNIIKRRTC